jgi:malonate decarboxylase delta subunit
MEKIVCEFPAAKPAQRRVIAGVVGSGDLEVLLEPNIEGSTTVSVNTSVDGMRKTWEALLTRIFTAAHLPAAKIEINDCGATPGVVRMRIEQAFEELNAPDSSGRRE